MEKVPDKIINKDLYIYVRNKIKQLYPKHSAYRSALIIKTYKEMGGKIKKDYKSDLSRWFKEEWINMDVYLSGDIVKCGDKLYIKKSACRPRYRISKETPITADEVIKLHGKNKVRKAIDIKNKDPQNLIIKWKDLNVIKKKSKYI